jgi:hypothetical protein
MVLVALPSAFGPHLLMSNDFMKPLLLFILSLLAIYKENFGQHIAKTSLSLVWNAILISIIVGFMMVLLVQELGF